MKRIIIISITLIISFFSRSQTNELDLNLFLEGPYFNGQMTPFLNLFGHLPQSQPYNTSPWNYEGDETVSIMPAGAIDWILVDILLLINDEEIPIFEVIDRKAGLLMSNGKVTGTDGTNPLEFNFFSVSQIYLRIHHRNHVSIVSGYPIQISGYSLSYDFTDSPDKVMGGQNHHKYLGNEIWGMAGGDGDQNGQIDNLDKDDLWLPQLYEVGYNEGDFDMDTQVDYSDWLVIWEGNAGKSAFIVKDSIRPPFHCGDSLWDLRDNQKYGTVQIGDQCWMSENLNIGEMQIGTVNMTDDGVIEKYCYNNNESYCFEFGGLYQWDEMMDYGIEEGAKGICPDGWHLPTDNEWCDLENYVDQGNVSCSAISWRGTNCGDQLKVSGEFGFNALMGGKREFNTGAFSALTERAYFWTSTYDQLTYHLYRIISTEYSNINRNMSHYQHGYSVRCIHGNYHPTWSCGDSLIDNRDDQKYATVQIGDQCWMAQNLNIGQKQESTINMSDNEIIEKYCYDNNANNCTEFGGLYQWDEMMDYGIQEGSQGICPDGWHLPTDNEWCELENYVDQGTVSCTAISWRGNDCGDQLKVTGNHGFNALMGGKKEYNSGAFSWLNLQAYFWTSTYGQDTYHLYRIISTAHSNINRNLSHHYHGYSVRCIKD